MKTIISFCIAMLSSIIVFSQNKHAYQEVEKLIGSPMPNYSFEQVWSVPDAKQADWPKLQNEMPLKDFFGKWTLVYFWTRSCTPCVYSFPKLNEYQKAFSKDINVLLLGINDQWNLNTKDFFDGVRLVQKINAVSYTFDTVLVKKMQISYAGTALLIDPKGVLRHVLRGSDLTKKQLQKLIARKE